jgi:hypothetical protein
MVYSPHPPYEILQTSLIGFATMQRLRRFARYWDLLGNSGNFVETAPLFWQTCQREDAGREQQPLDANHGRSLNSPPPDGGGGFPHDARVEPRNHDALPVPEHPGQPGRPLTPSLASVGEAQVEAGPGFTNHAAEKGIEGRSGGKPPASPFAAFLAFSDWLFGRARRTSAIALPKLRELVFEYLTTQLHWDQGIVARVLWRDCQRGGRGERPGFLAPHLEASQTDAKKLPTGIPRRQARHLGRTGGGGGGDSPKRI